MGLLSGEEAAMRRQQLMTELYRRTGPAKVPEAAAHIAALLEAGGSRWPCYLMHDAFLPARLQMLEPLEHLS